MHGRMASRRPTGAHAEVGGVIDVADVKMPGGNADPLRLGVAAQAQVDIPLEQQLRID